jgi:hypothetical protein
VALFVAGHIYLNIVTLLGNALTDFHVYHEALGRAARGEAVYDLGSPMPFLYPPFFLIVLWPMGWLSEPTAMRVWLYLQNLFLVVSLVSLAGVFRPRNWSLVGGAIILFAGFSPVMLNNLYGQANLLYLAVLSMFAWAYLRALEEPEGAPGLDIAAALALSVAIGIRILPAALLALPLLQRRYRMAVWTAGFVAVEALAAGAVVGFATEWDYFTSYVFHLRGLENMREISLWALARRVAPAVPIGTLIYAVAVAAGLGVFATQVCQPMRLRAPSASLHVAFLLISMVLFAPLLEYHHYAILLAPYTLILGDLLQRGRLTLTSALPVLLSWAIVSGANQLSHFQFGSIAFAALAGAALIWGYCIRLIVENPAGPPGRSPLGTPSSPQPR